MKTYIHETPKPANDSPIVLQYDVIVVGGGMSGICAALASARHGAKTAIIQDRSVFGGNASSETRMHISGASCHWGKENAAETGILMELQLENKYLNDSYNYSIWDGVLWSAVQDCDNLDSYMNTTMYHVDSDGETISSIRCYQMTTETHYELKADIFVDSTGNGTLGYFAGAEYKIGREDKSAYQEPDAPEAPDGETMGNTIYFCAHDTGRPVKFVKPSWAFTFDESDFKHRYHGDIVVYHDAEDVVVLKPDEDYENYRDQLVEKYDVQSGYWWIELGGDYDDIIKQSEDIRYELYQTVYGVWDHIKNGGDHGAENYELDWVGVVSGMRESRRLIGNYTLTENDIYANKAFDDGVAYGGWPMDEHTAGGFHAKGIIPSKVRSFNGFYGIPYGCYCSRTIKNMMMAGRIIGCSKLAMGSTRVMATCAVGGQAVGTAAAMSVKRNLTPKEFGEKHMKELRQELLKDDCYLLECKNTDPLDAALTSQVAASSERSGYEAVNVISGVSRTVGENSNLWVSDGIADSGEKLVLAFMEKKKIKEVRLTFDPGLSEEICISVSKAFIDKERKGVPEKLVKDFKIIIMNDDNIVYEKYISDNHQRQCVVSMPDLVEGDQVEIHVLATNGTPDARIFEVRIY